MLRTLLVLNFCLASLYAASPSFPLRINGNPAAFPLVSTFLLPGQTLALETPDSGRYFWQTGDGQPLPRALGPRAWSWQAPAKAGLYSLVAKRAGAAGEMRVQAFVLVPKQQLVGERLNGYRIGRYPAGGQGAYQPPAGFIEVTRENQNAWVAPHFQLKQFLCKQIGGYPKYLVLTDRLLTKLEMLVEKVNEHGFAISTFHVMSGYRTPAYNRGLGNVKLSRHQFGDAADIYIEDPATGQMADLNHDGKVDAKDAAVLYAMVQELSETHPDLFPVGGAGTYESTKAHGPFMHVDARGFIAKWGTIVKRVAERKS